MPNERFVTLVVQVQTLQEMYQDSSDPEERRSLLAEIHPLLQEMDRLIKSEIAASYGAEQSWSEQIPCQPSILQKSSNQHGIHAEGDSHEKQITSNDAGGSD